MTLTCNENEDDASSSSNISAKFANGTFCGDGTHGDDSTVASIQSDKNIRMLQMQPVQLLRWTKW